VATSGKPSSFHHASTRSVAPVPVTVHHPGLRSISQVSFDVGNLTLIEEAQHVQLLILLLQKSAVVLDF
jgi:hypothetical protein